MLAIPSVNLRDGKVVLLAGGDARHEALRFDDARQVARHWVRTGVRRLHCVDIDAATGHGHNLPTVRALLDDQVAAYQMGGGVRTRERIDELLNEGAEWVVDCLVRLGPRAP